VAFCRQAAVLEPNLASAFRDALAYADQGKDSKAMEWAVTQLLSQDWPTESNTMHEQASYRVGALAETLQKDNRPEEAARIKAALTHSRERDLIVKLTWENVSAKELSEVEMTIKEPTGTTCTDQQKQTPGGGTLIACNLFEKKATDAFSVTYTAAEAFSGDYEINVRRLWGQTFANRARLEIIQHAGTPKEKRRIEVVDLTKGKAIKVALTDGRRTELAMVSPANSVKAPETTKEATSANPWLKLRQMAFPDFVGAKKIDGNSSHGTQMPYVASRLKPGKKASVSEAPLLQTAITGSGINLTGQVRATEDGRNLEMVMNPIFQAMGAGKRSAVEFNGIPGSGN